MGQSNVFHGYCWHLVRTRIKNSLYSLVPARIYYGTDTSPVLISTCTDYYMTLICKKAMTTESNLSLNSFQGITEQATSLSKFD